MKLYVKRGNVKSGGPPREPPDNLIHFLTVCPLGELSATIVANLRSVNEGSIPRTCLLLTYPAEQKEQNLLAAGFTSRLKASFGLANVRFSERSLRPGKILICGSYSKEISKSEREPPSVG
jgi:hypothetical protein